MTGTGMTGTATGAAPSASDAPLIGAQSEHGRKPLKSSGFSPFRRSAKARENSAQLAGHPGIALLNDALSRRLAGLKASGRIAQLVEQLTLNQRVPGSSPGAPTKLFNSLGTSRESRSDRRSAAIPTNRLPLFAPRDASSCPKLAVCACAWHMSGAASTTGAARLRAIQRP
jgi:hypothetical protein